MGHGVKGREDMWHVIKKMYESFKSAVLLEGEKLEARPSLSPIYTIFNIHTNGKTVGGMCLLMVL